MVDAVFNFTITGVPSEKVVQEIALALQATLLNQFQTDTWIVPQMKESK